MKIGPEHVGKMARDKSSTVPEKILFVGKDVVVTQLRDGVEVASFNCDNWTLVEEPKKPSAIIAAAVAGKIYGISSRAAGTTFRNLPEYANDRIDVILRYLDEQAEKSK